MFFFIALVLTGGCAGTGQRATVAQPEVSLFWPPQPLKTRIKFIRSIEAPSSFVVKKEKGWFGKVFDFITGGEGPGGAAVDTPYGLYFDADAEVLFVADRGLKGIHRYDLREGKASFMREAGETPLEMPVMIVGGGDRYYVSDTLLNRVFVFNAKGDVVREMEDWGRPGGMAYNPAKERLYVVDVLQGRINAFDKDGNYQFHFGKTGVGKGEFNLPSNIWVDKGGRVYVTDSMNFRIQVFDEFGNHVKNIGKQGDSPGAFARPRGVAADSDGNIYVVDANFDNVQIFNQEGELLLIFGKPGTEAGEFTLPSGIFIDRNDRIYISDSYNKRIQVFQYVKEQVIR